MYKSEYKQKYEIAPDVVIQWKVVELYIGKKKMPIKDWIILYPRKVVQWKQQRLCSFFSAYDSLCDVGQSYFWTQRDNNSFPKTGEIYVR